jgi:uncharacterized OB-fold protein
MIYNCPVCGEVTLPEGARKCYCKNPLKIEVQAEAQSEDVPAIEVSSYKNKRKTKF